MKPKATANRVTDGCDTAVLWMLADNPTRFFYEGLGGDRVGHRVDRLGGSPVDEIAYAWRDLEVLTQDLAAAGVLPGDM